MKKYIQPQLQVHEIMKYAVLLTESLPYGGDGEEGAEPIKEDAQMGDDMWNLYK